MIHCELCKAVVSSGHEVKWESKLYHSLCVVRAKYPDNSTLEEAGAPLAHKAMEDFQKALVEENLWGMAIITLPSPYRGHHASPGAYKRVECNQEQQNYLARLIRRLKEEHIPDVLWCDVINAEPRL